MPRQYKKRAVPKRRRVPRAMKMNRKMRANGVPEWASLTESIQDTMTSQLITGTADSYNGLCLAQTLPNPFVRAQQVAQQYQFFRIKKVTYTIKPTFDTYSTSGTNTLPYLYWIINKTGESLSLNQFDLLQRGARPIRVDDKNVTISYRPTVGINSVQASQTSPFLNPSDSYRTSPWLNTNDNISTVTWSPSQVLHYGHYMMITQAAPTQFDVNIQVEFEFKKPRFVDVSPAAALKTAPREVFKVVSA